MSKRVTLEDLDDIVGRLTEMAKKIGWQEPPVLRCEHCGDNEDVAPEHDYKTNTEHYFCKDRVRCWTRWDEQHGIETK